MKFAAIALAAASLAAAGTAVAAGRVTDVDYLRASRCKGLAEGLPGVIDSQALDAYLKMADGQRSAVIHDRAEGEVDRARRQARSEDRKARLTAELTGPCQAYLGEPSSMAKR
ncbi:hypothetical protein [Phenylobacterium sp.]|uniref:hypothetical protein n=1 Tax=Phenylobacterium sp. TaxID=1871053 RepID=UPI00391CB358